MFYPDLLMKVDGKHGMRIALAQLNPIVGDLRGNADLIVDATQRAVAFDAQLVVASELFISGYPPKDLLYRSGFAAACDRIVSEIARRIDPGVGLLLGHPTQHGVPHGRCANAASLLFGGEVVATRHKALLPNYDVFDEQRYFRAAESVHPMEFHGLRLGVHICEDAWWPDESTYYHDAPCRLEDPIARLAAAGVDLFINLSASPFEIDKPDRRLHLLAAHARQHARPFVFVNQVGGNDDLVFDGDSFVLDAQGLVVCESADFRPDLQIIDIESLPAPITPARPPRESMLLDALVLGLRDYMTKSGFSDCVLGLSGGIDSALAACIAAYAAGAEHVHGLLMPSRYSSDHSLRDAWALASHLGIDAVTIPIDRVHKAYEQTEVIGDDLSSEAGSLADQNLQARIRGAMVMTRSNRHGWLALATGNKSELAVGYCTLYGDMAGGFAVLCDLYKRDVYAVARSINQRERREVVPVSTLEKAPGAELAPNQFDQDSLPPYPLLDGILEGLIEREQSVATLCEQFPADAVRWVARKLDRNEFKRRQMPPGIKLSRRAFGSGRRMPMAARIEPESV